METDNIIEIGIDNIERLYIKPEKVKFTLIYRTATEVHWDNENHFLYSPKPKNWTYVDWYKHIIIVAEDCNCKLIITEKTKWENISEKLKTEICK
ncbi:hypothetical protein [Flavobacterium turcicum]|uniref:Integron Cassette Protein Hfx-Cass5 domain-containing protein n=1 Tax=Flavobacterium turcicum TaxID=2764718 RepID=A0ABR7JJJ6_9FLAO|nr:hypothetical protein [Flavobacterium turcicum]MBC5864664.1 hypothetical protein [Flavobacterium turcicum]NHL03388.1 hypothetical protein [Flavobacterium turcicum]